MKSRTLQITCFSLSILLLQGIFASQSEAQFARRGGGLMAPMLGMEKVQKELGLEGDDATKVTEQVQEMQSEMRETMREIFQDSQGDREAMMKKFREINEEYAEKEKKMLKELLNEKQLKRLKQLNIQRQGVAALTNKEFADKIGLSSDLQKKISETMQEVTADMREKMREAMQDRDRDAMQKIAKEGREQAEKAVMELLSDDERRKFEEAKGEAFEFPQAPAGGRRGGGRRGRPRADF